MNESQQVTLFIEISQSSFDIMNVRLYNEV